MKKTLFAAALLAACMTSFAQNKDSRDLLSDLEDKIISERQEKKAKGDDDKRDIVEFKILDYYSYGWSFVSPSEAFSEKANSYEHDLNFIGIEFNPAQWLSFNVGFGGRWNKYVAGPGYMITRSGDDVTVTNSLIPGAAELYSCLKTFSLTIPVYATFRAGDFGFSFGADVLFTMPRSTSVVNEYWIGNTHYTATQWNGNLEPVNYDFFGQVMYEGAGFFMRYSPSKLLPKVDNFSTFTIGVRLNFWEY